MNADRATLVSLLGNPQDARVFIGPEIPDVELAAVLMRIALNRNNLMNARSRYATRCSPSAMPISCRARVGLMAAVSFTASVDDLAMN
jgi:hypothetical protein